MKLSPRLCLPLCCLLQFLHGGTPDKPLFDEGLTNAEFPEGVWTRDADGVITASEDRIIWSVEEYDDFILQLEFKTESGTNSGVFVYASDTSNWVTDSVEIQIADDYADTWASADKSWQCGAFFGRQPAYVRAVNPPGEWNKMTIICSGPMITVHLNGKRVNTFDLREFTSAKTNPDGSDVPPWLSKAPASLPTSGKIGFQGKHGGAPIYFRNIRVMELE